MIRKEKNSFQVECSHCKNTESQLAESETGAVEAAENEGFAIIGKFQFCPQCFSDMLERWKEKSK